MLTPCCSLSRPTTTTVREFLQQQAAQPFSYREVGRTAGRPPWGYAYDDNHVQLGEGEACFVRACAALHEWKMFPPGWTAIDHRPRNRRRRQLRLCNAEREPVAQNRRGRHG